MRYPLELTLPFLEKRTYLHGTTLFDALQPFLPRKCKIRFKIRQVISSNHIAVVDLHNPDRIPGPMVATLSWETSNSAGGLGVKSLPQSEEVRHISYDESKLTDLAIISNNGAELRQPSPFSFIATVVPLNKAILLGRLPQKGEGQWFFTALDIDYLPESFGNLGLSISQVVGGGRIVKTAIIINHSLLGDLYFSWQEKRSTDGTRQ